MCRGFEDFDIVVEHCSTEGRCRWLWHVRHRADGAVHAFGRGHRHAEACGDAALAVFQLLAGNGHTGLKHMAF